MESEALRQEITGVIRDPGRLRALAETGLLDSEVEEQFDRLTRIASMLLGVPATFFSLVDEDRDFYKSCVGFAEPLSSDRELTGTTFCHYSLVSEGALVIPDTRADPVYRKVPTVETLGVAAYLGVPVRAPGGEVLGSFCAIDTEPKAWTPLEIEIMKELASSAEREVAIRHWLRRQRQVVDRELAAREELERVMESRGRLMRGFTHDVKNPLGAAEGYLALLEDEVLGPLAERQREAIGRVRRSIGTALGLIDELVEIERAEAGRLSIARGSVDLRELALDLVEEYAPQARARGLRIRSEMPAELPPVLSNPDRIRQVLSNLLSNAVKYTMDGEIVVAARVLSDGSAGSSSSVSLDVIDTGPGISESDLDRLFQEFTRLNPSAGGGAGLGLAISRRLAEALGGGLRVKSRPGEGSTFTLWLPLEGGSPGSEAPLSPSVSPRSR